MDKIEKAQELEKRITAAIDAGEFSLGGGYLWGPKLNDKRKCRGCALAAAAFVLSDRIIATGTECENLVCGGGGDALILEIKDARQLEMAYEQWAHLGDECADAQDPFYQLGVKLALRADAENSK